MEEKLQQIQKVTMAEVVIEQIFGMINSGALKPGDRLPTEKELQAALNVSRPTLREAMRSLKSMGIIQIRAGDGTYLNESIRLLSGPYRDRMLLHRFSYRELAETRETLETRLAELSALNATPAQIDEIEAALAAAEECENRPELEFHSIDQQFHNCIARSSGNSFMADLLEELSGLLILMKGAAPDSREIRSQSFQSSRAILEAIRAHDSKLAGSLMKAHVQDTANNVFKFHEQEDTV